MESSRSDAPTQMVAPLNKQMIARNCSSEKGRAGDDDDDGMFFSFLLSDEDFSDDVVGVGGVGR